MRVQQQAFIVLRFFITFHDVMAFPLRGIDPWTVILCKFRDNNHEPHSKQWVEEWIAGRNADSITNFFNTLSNGVYSIEGSNVTRWIQIPWTRQDVVKLASEENPGINFMDTKGGTALPFPLFDKSKQLCAGWAAAIGIEVRPRRVILLNSERTAVFGRSNGVLISPTLAYSSVLAHEMVHSMNIGHSYSDRGNKVFPHAAPGEYGDRYDLMSTANAWMHATRFGWAGPGLAGPHLEYLGWLPQHRIAYFGANRRRGFSTAAMQQIRLSSLSLPHTSTTGTLLIMLPYDRDEPANVYTIEYRTPSGNDQGLQQPAVIIHNVKRAGDSFFSYLLTHKGFDELTGGTEWVHFIEGGRGLIRVRVDRVMGWDDVKVSVLSTFDPKSCMSDEVRIGLNFTENMSSEGEDKDVTRLYSTASRGIGKEFDEPLTFVCLEKERAYSFADLQRQRRRMDFLRRPTFGQNECAEGRVWRNLDPYDYVCVPPHRVWEARRAAVQRMVDDHCPRSFSRRMAFEGDRACVTVHERVKIMSENRAARRFYRHASFFNGDDEIIER